MSDPAVDDPFGTGLPIDTVTSRPRPGTILLQVDGELDTLTAPRLEVDLNVVIDAGRAEGAVVVVDLSGVTFLASSGLAVLVHGGRRVGKSGGRLHLVVATRAVARPLEVTGADALFTMHDDAASALAVAAPAAVAPPAGE